VWLKLDNFSHEQTDFSLTQKLTEHSRIAEKDVVGNIIACGKFVFVKKRFFRENVRILLTANISFIFVPEIYQT